MPLQLFVFLLKFEDYMLPCMNKKLFGFECPGCGLQRAVALLIKGDFVGAFQMYPAIYTLISLVAVLLLNRVFSFKHYNTLVITLSIASVFLIITNYIIKLFH